MANSSFPRLSNINEDRVHSMIRKCKGGWSRGCSGKFFELYDEQDYCQFCTDDRHLAPKGIPKRLLRTPAEREYYEYKRRFAREKSRRKNRVQTTESEDLLLS